jgi:Tfp pilus assembly protein PilF
MRLPALIIAAVLALSAVSASAQEEAAPPAAPDKKAEVPFREDSGLITAEFYLATGKYTQALDVADGVLARHPDNADAYTYRGFAFERLGDTAKARAAYEKALEVSPTHLGANRYLAGLYLSEGDLGRAMDQMQVIRMTCGQTGCAELDDLEAEINLYKSGQKPLPKVKKPRFAPDNHLYQNN